MTKDSLSRDLLSQFKEGSYCGIFRHKMTIDVQGYKVRIQESHNMYYRLHVYKKGHTYVSRESIYGLMNTCQLAAETVLNTIDAEVESMLLLDNGISKGTSIREPNDNT